MRKKYYFKILLMIVLCMIFTSCKKESPSSNLEITEDKQSEVKEVWKETLVPYPQTGFYGAVNLSDNEMPIYNAFMTDEVMRITERKGTYQWDLNTWNEISVPWEQAYNKQQTKMKNSDNIIFRQPQKMQDGKYYNLKVETLSGDTEYTLYRLNNRNQFEIVKTKNEMFLDDEKVQLYDFNVLSDGTIVILFSNKLIRYDLISLKRLNICDNLVVGSGKFLGDDFISVNQSSDKILVTDVKTGTTLEEIDCKVSKITNSIENVNYCRDEKGNLYFATSSGIFCKEKTGEEAECIVPSEKCSIYVLNEKENVYMSGMNIINQSIFISYGVLGKTDEQLYEYSLAK